MSESKTEWTYKQRKDYLTEWLEALKEIDNTVQQLIDAVESQSWTNLKDCSLYTLSISIDQNIEHFKNELEKESE